MARYLSSAQGRFTSPDPLLASARLTDPQTWNRYAYVRNDPVNLVDPDGRNRTTWDGNWLFDLSRTSLMQWIGGQLLHEGFHLAMSSARGANLTHEQILDAVEKASEDKFQGGSVGEYINQMFGDKCGKL